MRSTQDRSLSISEVTLSRIDPQVQEEEHCLSSYGNLSPVKSPLKRAASVLGSGPGKPMPPSKMRKLNVVQSHEYRKTLLSTRRYLPSGSKECKANQDTSIDSSSKFSFNLTLAVSDSLEQASHSPTSSRSSTATGSHRSKYCHPDYISPKKSRRRWDEKRNTWLALDNESPSMLPKRSLEQANQCHKTFKLGEYGLSSSLPPSFKFE